MAKLCPRQGCGKPDKFSTRIGGQGAARPAGSSAGKTSTTRGHSTNRSTLPVTASDRTAPPLKVGLLPRSLLHLRARREWQDRL